MSRLFWVAGGKEGFAWSGGMFMDSFLGDAILCFVAVVPLGSPIFAARFCLRGSVFLFFFVVCVFLVQGTL